MMGELKFFIKFHIKQREKNIIHQQNILRTFGEIQHVKWKTYEDIDAYI